MTSFGTGGTGGPLCFIFHGDALENAVSGTEGRILVGGDFNARAVEWGMPQSDSRGKRIPEMLARIGLVVLNTGFGAQAVKEAFLISLLRRYLWHHRGRVLEDFSASDHQYIAFEVVDGIGRLAQHLHANEEAYSVKAQYRSAKRRLHSAINKSKARGGQNLVNEVNNDP